MIMRTFLKFSLAILFAAVCLTSCKHDEPFVFSQSVDGLWVSSANNLDADVQTLMFAEFADGTARIYTYKLGKGLESIFDDNVYNAAVSYSSSSGKGKIKVEGDASMNFEFGLSSTSDMMFLRNDKERFALAKYDSTLDEMVGSLKASFTPRLQLPSGFEGPTEYVSLSSEIPSLSGTSVANLYAGETIWQWIAKGLVSGSASTVARLIIQSLIQDEESKQLDEILSQVSLVNAQLAELINLVHNTTYEKYLNERTNAYLNPMRNLSNEYILRVKEAWQDDPESVGPIVIEWANRTVGGNPAYVEVKNFIDYLTGTVVEQKNLYQMYDMYVFNTHPWENKGYAMRENLRAGDLAVIAQSLFLTRLYYAYGDFSETTRESLCNDLKDSFEGFKNFCDNNSVVHHDDQAICQIKGAHFTMPVALVARDFQDHPWMPYKTPWEFENQESAWWLVNGDTEYNCAQIYRFCMTEDEAKAIAGYYKGSTITCMAEALTQEAGCILPFSESQMSGKKIMMQLQTDASDPHQEDNNYYINPNKAIEASKDFNIGTKTIGIAWLERHGFLWMEQWFRQWDTYYDNQLWFRTQIISRY